MSDMSYNIHSLETATEIGTSELRELSTSAKLRRLMSENHVVRVARYRSETDAWLVEPELWDEMVSERREAREMKRTLPLILGALLAGVKIPSETLSALGMERGDASWRALNEFQARYGIEPVVSEDGLPLPAIDFKTIGEVELDEELVTLVD